MDSDDNKYDENFDNNENSQDYSMGDNLKDQDSSDDENTQHAKSNKAITDFISRQFAANERMQKIRDNEKMEEPKTENRRSSSNSPEHKKISDPAKTEALFKSSLKSQREEEKKKPEPASPRISVKSKQLANAKNERQINAIFSGLTKMNQVQFDGLMRRFSIKSPDLIESLKEYSRITNTENEEACEEEEDKENALYNGTKLKKLMISAANKENDTKLVKKIQPFVTAALANSISMLSPKLRNGSSYSRKPQSSLGSKPMQKKQREQKNEPVEKKQARPKTATKSGSKYLPDFYENIEFNDEPTPRYRTKHTYLAEKPKKPWK